MKKLTETLTLKRWAYVVMYGFLFFSALSLSAQETETVDKTMSPRFYIPDGDTTLDALPLKLTKVDVSIAGVIADVTVKQVYTNEGSRTIEARYVFPASTRAAVYYLQMKINQRLMIADIKEKAEAQQIYEEAKEEGNTATLLEQMTPNVFRMNVANILPGDTIEIEMKYTEFLVPTESVYEFVYPTVVGPRYTGEGGEKDRTGGPYQHEGEDPLYKFEIDVKLNAGMPINKISCISDPGVIINQPLPEKATVSSGNPSIVKGNKDFILQYSLSGNSIQTGVLAYEGDDENYFIAMLQPPDHPELSQVPPREYVFIMDISGSMYGFPISVSKTLLKNILLDLRMSDRFNILFFAGGSYLFSSKSVQATPENINAAIKAIDEKEGGGGTNLLSAVNTALDLPSTLYFSRIFVILTDGYVTVEKETFEAVRNNLGDANFFAFGIGSSVNRYIIEGIAHAGQGEPFIATNQEEAVEKADLFENYIEKPVLTGIISTYDNFDAYDIEPKAIPDVFAERPVVIYGKYNNLSGSINIEGSTGGEKYENSIDLSDYKADPENKALRYLWARKRIQELDDYSNVSYGDTALKNEIIELGLKYNLLTAYTSFVVVDSIIRCDTCTAETVDQPLPLPEGVTDMAVSWGASRATWNMPVSLAMKEFESEETSKKSLSKIQKVFPNPILDKFQLSVFIDAEQSFLDKKLQVFDLMGRLIAEINIGDCKAGKNELYLNIKNFEVFDSGSYFICLKVDNIISDVVKIEIARE